MPALPTWTYGGTGNPSSGQFTTNNTSISGTASINFHGTAKYGDAAWNSFFQSVPQANAIFILTDSQGRSSIFQTGSQFSAAADGSSASVSALIAQSGDWDGDYQLCIIGLGGFNGSINPITSIDVNAGRVLNAS